MKTWDQFFPDILVHVPGCPDPTVEHAVLRAAQEFLDTTRVWKIWLDDTATVADQTEYFLPLESNSELVRLERATLDGRQIDVRAEEDLPADWRSYPNTLSTGVHSTDRKTMVLLPAQQSGLVLMVQASLKPSETATGVENDLFDLYREAISAGAVARLKDEVDKPYTDGVGAQKWRGRFEGHMNTTSLRRARGFSSFRRRPQIKTF